jgi:hypothetical protein
LNKDAPIKFIIFLTFLLSVNISVAEDNLYFKSYTKKNPKGTVQEIERGINYSLLEVDITDGSPVASAMVIIAAAVDIGTDLQKTHFISINEYKKGKFNYYKIFFTSDIKENPSKVFPNAMSKDKLDIYNKKGYLSIETYRMLFNSVIQTNKPLKKDK